MPPYLTLQQRLEAAGVDGLRQMLIEAGRQRPLLVLLLAPAGNGDQRHIATPARAPDALRQLVAVEFRHSDVEEKRIRLKPACEIESLASRMRDADLVTGRLKESGKSRRAVAIVVRHEQPQRLRRLGRRRPFIGIAGVRGAAERQPNHELASLPHASAVRADSTAVQL